MTTPDEALIAQLQEAHGRATKGEWSVECGAYDDPDGVFSETGHAYICSVEHDSPNASLIVLSHNALPRLIELAREAIRAREEVQAALERFRYHKHKIPHPALEASATPENTPEEYVQGWDDAMASVERVIDSDIYTLSALSSPAKEASDVA